MKLRESIGKALFGDEIGRLQTIIQTSESNQFELEERLVELELALEDIGNSK